MKWWEEEEIEKESNKSNDRKGFKSELSND